MISELKTERFVLRVPTLKDASTVTELVQDPQIYEKLARVPPRQSVEQTSQWILGIHRGNELGIDHTTLIVNEGAVIGAVGAHRPALSEPFEIGYWVVPEHWGRGVATEAARALIAWLDAREMADTLVSGYFVDNPASGRVLTKLGFEVMNTSQVFCLGRGREVEHVHLQRLQRKLV